MSRKVDAATARLRLVLVIAVGGVIALLLPAASATTVDAPSAVALAALALAVAALVVLNCHGGATSVVRAVALQPGTADAMPSFLAGRVTDPLHHPLRPRAPGLV